MFEGSWSSWEISWCFISRLCQIKVDTTLDRIHFIGNSLPSNHYPTSKPLTHRLWPRRFTLWHPKHLHHVNESNNMKTTQVHLSLLICCRHQQVQPSSNQDRIILHLHSMLWKTADSLLQPFHLPFYPRIPHRCRYLETNKVSPVIPLTLDPLQGHPEHLLNASG